jgi:hypothetical protein
MSRNQFPDIVPIVPPDLSSRHYSRYPTEAIPRPAVQQSDGASKAMAIASGRRAIVPLNINSRSRNGFLEVSGSSRAPEAMLDSKEVYYQVCSGKYQRPFLLPTRKQQGTYCTPAGNAGQRARVARAIGAWAMPELGASTLTGLL